jgi:hypothetical protein
MTIRLKHLLWANAFVAVYLSLCRTAAWAMRPDVTGGRLPLFELVVLLGSAWALDELAILACRCALPRRLGESEGLIAMVLVAIGCWAVAMGSLVGAAWYYGIGTQ